MMDTIQDKEVFWRWPERSERPILGSLIGGFSLVLYLLWVFVDSAQQHDFTTNIHWDFERQIPFMEEAVVFYLSMIPMLF